MLADISANDWRAFFHKHLEWARTNNRIAGKPHWDTYGLNVIGIRMNPIEDFYVKGGWNDFLILVQGANVTVFPCTIDPARVKVNPRGVAHLNEGCWDSYVRGYHRAATYGRKRRALVQTKNPVRITRTDYESNVLLHEWGFFGINIHNAAGLRRPSAGCTVIKPLRGFMLRDRAYRRFAAELNAAPDVPSRTYCLMNSVQAQNFGVKL